MFTDFFSRTDARYGADHWWTRGPRPAPFVDRSTCSRARLFSKPAAAAHAVRLLLALHVPRVTHSHPDAYAHVHPRHTRVPGARLRAGAIGSPGQREHQDGCTGRVHGASWCDSEGGSEFKTPFRGLAACKIVHPDQKKNLIFVLDRPNSEQEELVFEAA